MFSHIHSAYRACILLFFQIRSIFLWHWFSFIWPKSLTVAKLSPNKHLSFKFRGAHPKWDLHLTHLSALCPALTTQRQDSLNTSLCKMPYFHLEILWKGTVSAEFRAIRLKLCGECAIPQNFHTTKLGEITAFYTVHRFERSST